MLKISFKRIFQSNLRLQIYICGYKFIFAATILYVLLQIYNLRLQIYICGYKFLYSVSKSTVYLCVRTEKPENGQNTEPKLLVTDWKYKE